MPKALLKRIIVKMQKKQIDAEIASINSQREALQSRIIEEQNARNAKSEKMLPGLHKQKDELLAQLDEANSRLAEVNDELTKDRE